MDKLNPRLIISMLVSLQGQDMHDKGYNKVAEFCTNI